MPSKRFNPTLCRGGVWDVINVAHAAQRGLTWALDGTSFDVLVKGTEMLGLRSIAGFLVCIVIVAPVTAEKRNLSPKSLKETATHVITGQVLAIYEREKRTSEFETTHYLAEVRINDCEKGAGLRTGELIYVRYWHHKKWIGKGNPTPGTSGHRGLPQEDDLIRVYLAQNAQDGFNGNQDGGFNVIGANGFEPLKQKPKE